MRQKQDDKRAVDRTHDAAAAFVRGRCCSSYVRVDRDLLPEFAHLSVRDFTPSG